MNNYYYKMLNNIAMVKISDIKNNKHLIGFTLIELLVVIAIIAILATIAMVGVNYARRQAKIAQVKSDTDQIFTAMNMLTNDTNEWPGHQTLDSTCIDIAGVVDCNNNEICADGCSYGLASSSAGIVGNDGSYAGWTGPYMNAMPYDPWGNEYFFDTDYQITVDNEPCDGGATCIDAAVIGSYGPDGIGNNQYNGDDIIRVIAK